MDRVYVMELVRAYQCGYMTRREFIPRRGIAVGGFAAVPSLLAACSASPANPPPVVATAAATAAGEAPAPPGTALGTAAGGQAMGTGAPRAGTMVTYPGPNG